MGRHQRAEAVGLLSFLFCAIIGGVGMLLYLDYASAFWQLSQRRFMGASALVAGCGVASFIVGYLHRIRSLALRGRWYVSLRRAFEILALSVVYASTLFLTSFMIITLVNSLMGTAMFQTYIPSVTAAIAGIAGYITFIQAELMDAKTLASLLPFFIVSGVGTAATTTTDPNWFNNNFSQLGDRTTFAASMFNSTLILGGLCIIIISYFALSELVATYRVYGPRTAAGTNRTEGEQDGDRQGNVAGNDSRGRSDARDISHFKTRMALTAVLLTLSGICFIGIGTFRYTPHPFMHNVFARGMPCVMLVMLLGLPWLVPQLSKSLYVISDLALAVCGVAGLMWLEGANTLTNVEALSGMLFLGWFIVFSRQIASIEDDRIQNQLLRATAGIGAPATVTAPATVLGRVPAGAGTAATDGSGDDSPVESAEVAEAAKPNDPDNLDDSAADGILAPVGPDAVDDAMRTAADEDLREREHWDGE
ncbi:ABC transporter permease [Bifidobacterium choloepi]|uniref:ABC transporter permease n=1 Tax=Bifidobacterium choloepi TaxID=2614131 RepID=UPI001E403FBB|nr:ABC transporter permease [Bifidobacterium choloepi]